jgi:hypothetical protein
MCIHIFQKWACLAVYDCWLDLVGNHLLLLSTLIPGKWLHKHLSRPWILKNKGWKGKGVLKMLKNKIKGEQLLIRVENFFSFSFFTILILLYTGSGCNCCSLHYELMVGVSEFVATSPRPHGLHCGHDCCCIITIALYNSLVAQAIMHHVYKI